MQTQVAGFPGRCPQTHAGSGVGVADAVGLGEGEIVGNGVIDGDGSGVRDGDGSGEVEGDAEGEGAGDDDVSGSNTASIGFTCILLSTLLTAGFENVGVVEPPESIEAVPVGETKTMFEFEPSAVADVHGILQKVVVATTGAGDEQSPEVTLPRWSNRKFIGNVMPSLTTRTLLRPAKSVTLDSKAGSRTPF